MTNIETRNGIKDMEYTPALSANLAHCPLCGKQTITGLVVDIFRSTIGIEPTMHTINGGLLIHERCNVVYQQKHTS